MHQSPFLQKVSDEMMRRRYAKRTYLNLRSLDQALVLYTGVER